MNEHTVANLLRDDTNPGIAYQVTRPNPDGGDPINLGRVELEANGLAWAAIRPDGSQVRNIATVLDAVDLLDDNRRREAYRTELHALAAEAREHDPNATPAEEVDRLATFSPIGELRDTVVVYRGLIAAARPRWSASSPEPAPVKPNDLQGPGCTRPGMTVTGPFRYCDDPACPVHGGGRHG